jgi:hypothetical protein
MVMEELDELVEIVMGLIHINGLKTNKLNELYRKEGDLIGDRFNMGILIGKKQSLLTMLDIIGEAQTRQKDKLKLSNTQPTETLRIYEPGDIVEIVRDTGIELCIGEKVTVIADGFNWVKIRSVDDIELDLLRDYIKLVV